MLAAAAPDSAIYRVNYGGFIKVMTAISTIVLLGIATLGVVLHRGHLAVLTITTLLPPALLIGTGLFAVLRYEIDRDGLRVVRPIGRKLVTSRVTSVVADDKALQGAFRTFGNGGMFSLNGWFRLRRYGTCRLWVTDLRNLVVIHGDRGCVVVSPAQRESFISALTAQLGATA